MLGCELLAQVFAHLDIVETDYFGLQVYSKQSQFISCIDDIFVSSLDNVSVSSLDNIPVSFISNISVSIIDNILSVQYTDEKSVSRWIDPEKSIKKQTCKQRGNTQIRCALKRDVKQP